MHFQIDVFTFLLLYPDVRKPPYTQIQGQRANYRESLEFLVARLMCSRPQIPKQVIRGYFIYFRKFSVFFRSEMGPKRGKSKNEVYSGSNS